MAEIPDHVKAQADAEMTATNAQRFPVQEMGGAQPIDSYPDGGKALAIMREQKRLEMAQTPAPEPNEPDRS